MFACDVTGGKEQIPQVLGQYLAMKVGWRLQPASFLALWFINRSLGKQFL
jgi:hypothetical protein